MQTPQNEPPRNLVEDDPWRSQIEERYAVLRERHNRIKSERRNILTTLMGLSGGAIVLSASLLEKIAAERVALWLLILSWCFLGSAVVTALFGLAAMTARSMRYQISLEEELIEAEGSWRDPMPYTPRRRRDQSTWRTSSTRPFVGFLVELSAGMLFVVGALMLGMFAVLNLS